MTTTQKTALVLGGGGFIGNAMISRLKSENYWVKAIDLKNPEFSQTEADEFVIGDLRKVATVENALRVTKAGTLGGVFDEVYQFAADMGGAGFIFTGEHDAEIMHNSATINLNVLEALRQLNEKLGVNKTKIFYSSSACMYPEHNQLDPDNPNCVESSAYPANPDSEYGWEKLLANAFSLVMRVTTSSQSQSLAFTIFMAHKALGMVAVKKLQQLFVARLPNSIPKVA